MVKEITTEKMRPQQFWIQLLIISLVASILLFFLNQNEKLQPYSDFSWICLTVFIFITVGMYYIGLQSVQSKNKNAFTNAALGFIMGKMMLAIMVIVFYNQLAEPETKLYIIPFFIVYVIYTAFETYFMMRLAKS